MNGMVEEQQQIVVNVISTLLIVRVYKERRGVMKVKIQNTIYDSTKEPILLILTGEDKKNIRNMLGEAFKYCKLS